MHKPLKVYNIFLFKLDIQFCAHKSLHLKKTYYSMTR